MADRRLPKFGPSAGSFQLVEKQPLKVHGVARDLSGEPYADHAVHVHFSRPLSDDELRRFHEYLREFRG